MTEKKSLPPHLTRLEELKRENRLLKQGLDQAERILGLWDSAVQELRAAKMALRESQAFLDRVLTAAPEPLAVLDKRGRILLVNAATERLLCLPRERLVGKPVIRLLAPAVRSKALARFRDSPMAGSAELELAVSAGTRNVVVTWSALGSIDEKTAACVILTGQDITERKRAQEALRDSEERFRALFEQAGVGVAQVDAKNGRFVRINRRYCEILGYSAEELQHSTIHAITHPDDLQPSQEKLILLGAGKIRGFSLETRCCRKDGKIVWINLTVSPMWAPGEKPRFHVAVAQDITERVRAQKANIDLARQIQAEVAKNREKDHLLIQQSRLAAMGEMAHNIAHQWRQPLNALGILIANIRDDYVYHELDEHSLSKAVEKSQKLLEGMSKTIDDFRSFFQPDRDALEFDVGQAANEAIALMQAALTSTEIALVKTFESGLIAYGYPSQFAQAVLNVLANAKEAIQEHHVANAWIHVRLIRSEDQAVVSVEDNGGGIPEHLLPRIFEPYFTTKEQGSGIGLYMSKIIVERNMKGSISVANGRHGAIFAIAIPLRQSRDR